jgi:predicted nucleic acid-binding protein
VIVLDTNVLSELIRPSPAAQVLTWLEAQPRSEIFTTTITKAELLHGVQLLPQGQRKESLFNAVLAIFVSDLAGQVLSFDSDAAAAYAEIAASCRAIGQPISQSDAMIAAITRSRGAGLATRNIKDFCNCKVDLVNPWKC